MDTGYLNNDKNIIKLDSKDLTKPIYNVKSFGKIKYWPGEDVIYFIDNIKNPMHKMLFTLFWYTGCRVTEIISLKKSDIDFKNYIITIRWLKSRKAQSRNIPLHPDIKTLFEFYTAKMNQETLLFPLSRQRVHQLTNIYFNNGHVHMIRHSFAVNWLNNGGDLYKLSKMLGHSNIKNTEIYLAIVPQDVGKELIKINFR
jgi:integrase/recombinase XerD